MLIQTGLIWNNWKMLQFLSLLVFHVLIHISFKYKRQHRLSFFFSVIIYTGSDVLQCDVTLTRDHKLILFIQVLTCCSVVWPWPVTLGWYYLYRFWRAAVWCDLDPWPQVDIIVWHVAERTNRCQEQARPNQAKNKVNRFIRNLKKFNLQNGTEQHDFSL